MELEATPEAMMARIWIGLMALLVVLAGCSDTAPPTDSDDPGLDVDDDSGGIRGVVVDDAVTPLAGATISLSTGEEALSADDGTFQFTDLDPGTHFLQATKIGYEPMQTSVDVEAGVERPDVTKVQLLRIPGADPYLQPHTFDGFYECAYAIVVQTDSCDWVVRTVHDEGVTMVPRGIQNNDNTGYVFLENSTESIVQEGFFDTSQVPEFRISVAAAPIDNACDCSTVHLERVSDTGYTYGRLDKEEGAWPTPGQDFAVRGFIPFQDGLADVAYGVNIEFQIFTTLFHNYQAPEGWNIEERASFPAP